MATEPSRAEGSQAQACESIIAQKRMNFFNLTSSFLLLRRKYAETCDARARERAAFANTYAERYGRRAGIHYPSALSIVPNFSKWLKEEVECAMHTDDKLAQDVYEASKLPEAVATGYRAMYVYGMHLRIREAKEDKVTYDSGIAAAM
jgi:hypothetical protein